MSYDDDLFTAQFPSVVACPAGGITQATAKNWISRKPPAILLTAAERAEFGEKNRFRFTLARVIQIALTAELVRLGFGPREAAMKAAAFTDLSSGWSSGGEEPQPNRPARMPCELFATGTTLLLAYPDEEIGHVIRATRDTSINDALGARYISLRADSVVVVNVNRIVRRVRLGLNLPYEPREGEF